MRSLVIIPTYNEAENVVATLDTLMRAAASYIDVLVVDDNSLDGTANLVASHCGFGERINLLVREDTAGLGTAFRTGCVWALTRDYDVVVRMSADLSRPPERLLNLIEATHVAGRQRAS